MFRKNFFCFKLLQCGEICCVHFVRGSIEGSRIELWLVRLKVRSLSFTRGFSAQRNSSLRNTITVLQKMDAITRKPRYCEYQLQYAGIPLHIAKLAQAVFVVLTWKSYSAAVINRHHSFQLIWAAMYEVLFGRNVLTTISKYGFFSRQLRKTEFENSLRYKKNRFK